MSWLASVTTVDIYDMQGIGGLLISDPGIMINAILVTLSPLEWQSLAIAVDTYL